MSDKVRSSLVVVSEILRHCLLSFVFSLYKYPTYSYSIYREHQMHKKKD